MTSSPGIKSIFPVFTILLSVIIHSLPCTAQYVGTSADERMFLLRTKQFNEFLDRFNYKTNFHGEPVDSAFEVQISRERMINFLFDLADPRFDPSEDDYSAEYVDEIKAFVEDVIQHDRKIFKYSDKILAEARSRVIYKGSPVNISVFLTQEIVDRTKVKWVIKSVSGEVFNFLLTDTMYIRFIPPSSNETDFMNLKRALEDVNYLQYYADKDYEPDYLTLFFYMINSGQMKFEYVEEIIYHITDIPGWYIKVKNFNRGDMNSGWLISGVERILSGK